MKEEEEEEESSFKLDRMAAKNRFLNSISRKGKKLIPHLT